MSLTFDDLTFKPHRLAAQCSAAEATCLPEVPLNDARLESGIKIVEDFMMGAKTAVQAEVSNPHGWHVSIVTWTPVEGALPLWRADARVPTYEVMVSKPDGSTLGPFGHCTVARVNEILAEVQRIIQQYEALRYRRRSP